MLLVLAEAAQVVSHYFKLSQVDCSEFLLSLVKGIKLS
jgi:hypothetical protein